VRQVASLRDATRSLLPRSGTLQFKIQNTLREGYANKIQKKSLRIISEYI